MFKQLFFCLLASLSLSAKEPLVAVDQTVLDPEKAAEVLTSALEKTNTLLHLEGFPFNVVYNGQPGIPNSSSTYIIAKEPIDIALEYQDGQLIPIDMINVISYVGYSPEKGRLSSGFTDPSALAETLVSKVKNHLAALDNVSVLISNVGSKYNTELLQNNTLSIDEQGFLRVNGCLVLTFYQGTPSILNASDLRSSDIMRLDESPSGDRIFLYCPEDFAPEFYFDTSLKVPAHVLAFQSSEREKASEYAESEEGLYYVLQRNAGKI